MDMDWEEFAEGQRETTAERIYVTLNKRKNFFFNRRTIEAMGEPDAVVLMYDRRRSVVGVKRGSVDDPKAFRLKKKEIKRHGGRVVYAANFCKHFGIDPSETLYFTDANVDKNGVLVLSLHAVKKAARKR